MRLEPVRISQQRQSVATPAAAGTSDVQTSAASWTQSLQSVAPAAPGAPTQAISDKERKAQEAMTELMLAQTLRALMPKGGSSEQGLAFDTWRGFLADHLAREVTPSLGFVLPANGSATEGQ